MSGLIRLENRSVIEVSGADARDFLQGIITNDIDKVTTDTAIYAGLLTPQGKLLFDFFIARSGDSYLLDVEKQQAGDLLKRLMFYKLRAIVELAVLEKAVVCADVDGLNQAPDCIVSFMDPRLAEMGQRFIISGAEAVKYTPNADKWLAHRVRLSIPEAGADYTHGDCFPHDIAMDQLNGIGFQKGCYVGQEIVSRMQHRGTARKRIMAVIAEKRLASAPADIEANGKVIGHIGSVWENMAIAEVRLDRATKALADGVMLKVDGVQVKLQKPAWANYGDEFSHTDTKR